jgi:phosphatidylethanolamine N-methyltransferase
MTIQSNAAPEMEGLRERTVQALRDEAASGSGYSSGQDTPQTENDVEKEKKTFGRTPDGTSRSYQAEAICATV